MCPGWSTTLRTTGISAVVDATHPFAATMSASAADACRSLAVPLLRLARPGWSGRPDAAGWTWVDSTHAAARALMDDTGTPFLTTGRQTLHHFAGLTDRRVLVRVVEPPASPLPVLWELIQARGPYRLADEMRLMSDREVQVLATKDSGGDFTSAKLDAAAELGVRVIVVRRPAPTREVLAVASAEAALAWMQG